MCGIAAIFAYGEMAPPVDREEVCRIRDNMAARGPDGEGEWFSADGRLGFGHRRLSIIDLSEAGAEPMFNRDRSLAILFNGEIYNYKELRSQLVAKGYQFHSHCDAEVVLALFETRGDAMMNELRGMYAFAIWDQNKRGLFMARDPFGIKPLYYADDGHTFRLASQVKALRAGGGIDATPDPAGHVGFFLWGHVPDPFTMYRNIRSLPAGHTMWVDRDGAKSPRRFHDVTSILREAEKSIENRESKIENSTDLLRTALAETVRYHMVADVPVGVFLSSGLDSTTIAALAAEQGGNLRTVTLGFEEYRGKEADETPLAEEFAKRCGAVHQTIWVSRADFEAERDHLFESMDRPTIDGVNTFFVSLAAKKAGLKVALSGVGGDELFATYPSFHDIPRTVRLLRQGGPLLPAFGRGMRILSAPILKRFTSPKYAGMFEYGGSYSGAYLLRRGMFMPWELPDLLDPEFARAGWNELQTLSRLDETIAGIKNPRLKISALELNWYMRHQLLRDADWAGMGHSVEIRVPFVDVEFLRQIAPALSGANAPSKRDMAMAASKLMTSEILDRRKTGFQIPVRNWLRSGSKYKPFEQWQQSRTRGLRGWAREVYSHFAEDGGQLNGFRRVGRGTRSRTRGAIQLPDAKVRVLMLLSDGFGGFGGIAKFNRDFIAALSSSPDVENIVAIPRLMSEQPGQLPEKLLHETSGLGGKKAYIWAVIRAARQLRAERSEHFRPVIVCGHINLLPAAEAARRIAGAKLYLIVHGVDAWQPTRDPIANRCAKRIDDFISVSAVTRRRFLEWSGVRQDTGTVLPNCVDLATFKPGPKSPELLAKYGLSEGRVLLTVGRLASEERYKGFDEVIECLPEMGKTISNLTYLIVGDGPDRPRLVEKARDLGLRVDDFANPEFANIEAGPITPDRSIPRVIFVGRIRDAEKTDYFRLADVFVMPSSGEGFGIVLLEAMACGIPVIGSKIDGSREALRQGELGTLVDPRNPLEITRAIISSLNVAAVSPSHPIPGVEYFSIARFEQRVHALLSAMSGSAEDDPSEKVGSWIGRPGSPERTVVADVTGNGSGQVSRL